MGRHKGRQTAPVDLTPTRHAFLAAAATVGVGVCAGVETAGAERPDTVKFGLTPVFLTNDLQLLSSLQGYLERAVGLPVQLVSRRTYHERVVIASRYEEMLAMCRQLGFTVDRNPEMPDMFIVRLTFG